MTPWPISSRQPGLEVLAERRGAALELAGRQHLDHRGADRAASGLPPKVEPCSPGRSTPSTSRFATTAETGHDAAAERLAEQVDVGHDALVVAREGLAGAAEAGLDLVGDEQHVVRSVHSVAHRRAGSPPAGR